MFTSQINNSCHDAWKYNINDRPNLHCDLYYPRGKCQEITVVLLRWWYKMMVISYKKQSQDQYQYNIHMQISSTQKKYLPPTTINKTSLWTLITTGVCISHLSKMKTPWYFILLNMRTERKSSSDQGNRLTKAKWLPWCVSKDANFMVIFL